MNREEFFRELRSRLAGLPVDDLEDRLAFYDEMILESMEIGMLEQEAVAQLGTMDEIVAQVMGEIPLSALVRDQVNKPKKAVSTGKIVLLVLGFPIWFPVLVALFSVVLSLYLVLWVIVLSLYLVDFSLVVCILGAVASMAAYALSGNPVGMKFMAGAGIACAGFFLLLFQLCGLFARGMLKLTKGFFLWVKSLFIGKEGKKNA